MEYALLLQRITEHYSQKKPFVLFSLPESNSLTVYFQNDNELYQTDDFSEKSFILAPFEYKGVAYCIPADKSEIFETNYTNGIVDEQDCTITEDATEKSQYESMVGNVLRAIFNKQVKKVVTSRRVTRELKSFDLSLIVSRLFNLYPDALRYVWYHPETKLWCGASPEILFETNGTSFKTVALAGTKKMNIKRPPDWTQKEIDEQKFVTEAIVQSLQRVTSVVKISKTYTQKAGSLAHLKTDITGILKSGKATLSSIASNLHPTPAVCGSPQKAAKKIIETHENYPREFYSGFLGPVDGAKKCSNLFVNLRCMKIDNAKAYLYAGGGITSSSLPEDEWYETQNKLLTMAQVLYPLL